MSFEGQATMEAPAATTPALPSAMDATSGQAEQGLTGEQQSAEEFFLQGTETPYRTREDAIAGINHKDAYIKELKGLLQGIARPAPQAPAPQNQVNPVVAIRAELEMQYRQDPDLQHLDDTSIKALAAANAPIALQTRNQLEQVSQQFAQQQHQAFVAANPELLSPLGRELHEQYYQAHGRYYDSPETHLRDLHAEMYRRGIPRTGSSTTGIQGALANGNNGRQYANAGVGTQPGATASGESAYVQNALAFARSRGVTDPAELDRVKQTATQNEPLFRAQGVVR